MFDVSHIETALERIAPYVLRTRLILSRNLSERSGSRVFLKPEHTQPTGSFKIRGATNKVMTLPRRALDEGVVAASTGNHGAGVARAARILGGRTIVFVPENSSEKKLELIRRQDADIRFVGKDAVESELAARDYASSNDLAYVPPYNDEMVIAGQGTIGLELFGQAPDIDAVYVPVGGGGLISGIAAFLKSMKPAIEVVACSAEESAVMHHSVKAGRIVEMESGPTIADGTSGGIEPNTVTFDLCQELVDRWLVIPETEIVSALRLAITRLHQRIEGAAALAIAGLLLDPESRSGRDVAVVLSGGNITEGQIQSVLKAAEGSEGAND